MATEHLPKQAQSGITDQPREHLTLAALTFSAACVDPTSCHAAAEQLRALVRAELAGELAEQSTETGELGYSNHYDRYRLMITLGISSTGYDRLGAAAGDRPVDLHPMPADVVDPDGQGRPATVPGEGDLLLKVMSDDIFVTEHVLRRVEHELSAVLEVRWTQTGVQRYNTRSKLSRQESRALIGFLDGTSNLNPANADDRALIFTDHVVTSYPANPTSDQYDGASFPDLRDVPTGPEPADLDGGSYLAVEVLAVDTTAFDALGEAGEEVAIGRNKLDGSPLAAAAPASHVLKANPHRTGSDDDQRRMLRRGYSLIRPTSGTMTRGLIFLAFGRSLTTQHEFVRRAWIDNPNFPTVGAGQDQFLSRFTSRPLESGGYYFMPPLTKASDKASWRLPAAPPAE